jgi:hypothetical protein
LPLVLAIELRVRHCAARIERMVAGRCDAAHSLAKPRNFAQPIRPERIAVQCLIFALQFLQSFLQAIRRHILALVKCFQA